MLCGVWNRHERTKCKRLPLFSRCITARKEPLEEPKKSKKASLLNLETLQEPLAVGPVRRFWRPFTAREAPSSDGYKTLNADGPRTPSSCGKCKRSTVPRCKLFASTLVGGTGPKAISIKSICSFGFLLRDHRRKISSAREITLPSAQIASSATIRCATRLSSSKPFGRPLRLQRRSPFAKPLPVMPPGVFIRNPFLFAISLCRRRDCATNDGGRRGRTTCPGSRRSPYRAEAPAKNKGTFEHRDQTISKRLAGVLRVSLCSRCSSIRNRQSAMQKAVRAFALARIAF